MGGKGSPRPDVLLEDRDTIKIGAVTLMIIHTPGGIRLQAGHQLFTGDTVFIGSAAGSHGNAARLCRHEYRGEPSIRLEFFL